MAKRYDYVFTGKSSSFFFIQESDWYDLLIDNEDPLLGPFKPELIEEKKESPNYYNR
jgi:hypothetical protein